MKRPAFALLLALAACGGKYKAPPAQKSIALPTGAQLKPYDPAHPGNANPQGLAQVGDKVYVFARQGGDEVVGMSRGFLFAGASTLVQSLWRVEDASTARLMERFYLALERGRPAGAALRHAQLAALGESGSHPYQWAPFQLAGHSGA